MQVRVDVSGMSLRTCFVQPEISTPQGVTWIGNEPGTVQVTLRPDTPEAATPVASPVATPDAE